MFLKAIVLCVLVAVQSISAEFVRTYDTFAYEPGRIGNPSRLDVLLASIAPIPLANVECAGVLGPKSLAASNSGGLAVTSVSPITPNGMSVVSENAYEGPLIVAGQVPFLGAVALEGVLPSDGTGTVVYACGRGTVSILSESIASGLVEALKMPALSKIGCSEVF